MREDVGGGQRVTIRSFGGHRVERIGHGANLGPGMDLGGIDARWVAGAVQPFVMLVDHHQLRPSDVRLHAQFFEAGLRMPSHGGRFLRRQAIALVQNAGRQLPLAAGMSVSAEIIQDKRTVFEYLLSPVQRVVSEAGRER